MYVTYMSWPIDDSSASRSKHMFFITGFVVGCLLASQFVEGSASLKGRVW